MKEQKFYICGHCGNIVSFLHDSGVPIMCCGAKMKEIAPNTVEAATEKHIPAVTISGDTISVQIGSVIHPMVEEHHIEFIYLQTENGGQRKSLKAGEEPAVTFKVADDKPLAVYEYCNLHGLWKVDISGN